MTATVTNRPNSAIATDSLSSGSCGMLTTCRLRGTERWQPGNGPARGGGVRWLEAAGGRRQRAGRGRILDLSAPGQPDVPGEHHGQRREVGLAVSVPGYATDDQTAIQVVDGAVNVVSEGHWRLFSH